MEQGTLAERYLEACILRNIDRKAKADCVVPAVGVDYSMFQSQISADGYGETPTIAWNKAMNNFLCSLGEAQAARICMLLPKTIKSSEIAGFETIFNELARRDGCRILGGHTQVSDHFLKPSFYVTIMGERDKRISFAGKALPGLDVVIVGYAGLLGTNLLIEKKSLLRETFSQSFLDSASFSEESYSIAPAIKALKEMLLAENNLLYGLHDVSTGGIYNALWQLGKRLQTGLLIENSKIPIRQQTVEICEKLASNPYLLDGTGALVVCCNHGHRLKEKLMECKLPVDVIGKTTEEKERRIHFGENEFRTLGAVTVDAVWQNEEK